MPKILVTDSTFPSLDIEEAILAPIGGVIDGRQCRTEAALIEAVAGADAIITQFAPITARVVAAMDRARLIVRYGIGVDNVNLDATRARGIPVCNVPSYCIDEVADHTLALLLDATRRIFANGRLVREGGWGLAGPLHRMRSLRDMTVGVVGFGRIGRAVSERLRGFGPLILGFDPNVPHADFVAHGATPTALDDLIAESDAVTLHCPSTPETRHLINRESIARMKPGAILINVARGDVVETGALIEALQNGQIAAAGLDVAETEPLPADSPLRTFDGVTVTSHIASASAKAVRTLRESVAGAVARSIRGEPPINVVNGVVS